jgi:hypothetical protein
MTQRVALVRATAPGVLLGPAAPDYNPTLRPATRQSVQPLRASIATLMAAILIPIATLILPRSAEAQEPAGAPVRIGGNDFNHDGHGDILWHDGSSGAAQVWFMNGHQRSGRATVLGEDGSQAHVGLPWSIVGSRDFDGDGEVDVLWHNSATGEIQIWHLKGQRVSGRATVLGEDGNPSHVGAPWRIAGTIDHDRAAAILWQNDTTGEAQIWSMNDHRVTGRTTVLGQDYHPAFLPSARLMGSGDFNGDGQADILWQDKSEGILWLWYLDGQSITGQASVLGEGGDLSRIRPPWTIVATNDFNQDRTTDILWHNSSTNETQIWYMKGERVTSRATVREEHGRAALVGLPWSIMNH